MSKRVKPSKAEALLGIDKNVSSMSTTTIQIQGTIGLKEMSGKIKKRFCIVKDGFFIWYDKPLADSKINKLSFEKKPLGLFPLNGALVKLGLDKDCIELKHFEIPKSEVYLFPDKTEMQDWLKRLEEGSRSTYEQAQLGLAELERIKAKGTKLEKEKVGAVKLLQEKLGELEIANKKKNALLDKDRLQNERFEKQYGKAKQTLEEKENQIQELQKKYKEEETEMKKLNLKNQKLEEKLQKAHVALKRLDIDLQKFFGHDLASQKQPRGTSFTAKDTAVDALQTAMVQSSPNVRHRKPRPKVSEINGQVIPKLKAKKGPPKIPALPIMPPTVSKEEMQASVSREVVAQSVRAIKAFLDHQRKGSVVDVDSEGSDSE